jgi:predicted enzyme related to lactoylglutathione lyase
MSNRTAVALALVFATATALAAQSTSDKTTASGTPKDEPKIVPTQEAQMKRVTGIGGIFFHAKDPVALRAWYKEHLGIDVQDWGGAAFEWFDSAGNPTKGTTAWLIDAAGNDHFAPSSAPFMINYRVENLDALLQVLRAEGCNVLEKTDDSEYGKFGWVVDPEGNKVELWQPPEGQ